VSVAHNHYHTRFDIRFFFGLSGRHLHSVGTSAWVALTGAIIGTLYLRIKENRWDHCILIAQIVPPTESLSENRCSQPKLDG